MTPVYILILGYSAFYVGLALAVIIGGNIFSNVLLTWYGGKVGIRRALLAFSILMFLSGLILFASTYFPLILLACFIGNISTTGTEAEGPSSQSKLAFYLILCLNALAGHSGSIMS
jgi:MFS family permease